MPILSKNKIILVSSESTELFTTKRLLSEGQLLGFDPKWHSPYQIGFSLNVNHSDIVAKSGLYFHRTTGIRYDDFDLIVSQLHQDWGFFVTNPIEALKNLREKSLQSLFFYKHNLYSPPSIYYRGELSEKLWEEIIALSISQKYILKMIRGNQGVGVNLIEGHQSLRSLLETFHAMKDQRFLLQPYIEHKKEWRVFVINNKVIGAIERSLSSEDFRGNSKRSSGKWLKSIPQEMEAEILRATQLSGLDYCGIDLLYYQDQYMFLEINPVAGFEQLERLSGLNIARELIIQIYKGI